MLSILEPKVRWNFFEIPWKWLGGKSDILIVHIQREFNQKSVGTVNVGKEEKSTIEYSCPGFSLFFFFFFSCRIHPHVRQVLKRVRTHLYISSFFTVEELVSLSFPPPRSRPEDSLCSPRVHRTPIFAQWKGSRISYKNPCHNESIVRSSSFTPFVRFNRTIFFSRVKQKKTHSESPTERVFFPPFFFFQILEFGHLLNEATLRASHLLIFSSLKNFRPAPQAIVFFSLNLNSWLKIKSLIRAPDFYLLSKKTRVFLPRRFLTTRPSSTSQNVEKSH